MNNENDASLGIIIGVACFFRRSFVLCFFLIILLSGGGAYASSTFFGNNSLVGFSQTPSSLHGLGKNYVTPISDKVIEDKGLFLQEKGLALGQSNKFKKQIDLGNDDASILDQQIDYLFDPSLKKGEMEKAVKQASEELDIDSKEESPISYLAHFQWFSDVNVAFFQRHGVYWLVFDRYVPAVNLLSFDALRPVLKDFHVNILKNALIIKFSLKKKWHPSLEQSDLSWQLKISREPYKNPFSTSIYPIRDNVTGHVVFSTHDNGNVLHVKDPLLGDNLWIGMVKHASAFSSSRQVFPLFNMVPSMVGVVVETLSDKVEMLSDDKGFSILSKINVSSLESRNKTISHNDEIPFDHLFNFPKWQVDVHDTFHNNVLRLNDRISNLPEYDAAFEHIKFDVAYNLPYRALGMIQLFKNVALQKSESNKDLFRALEGAADALAYRYNDAKKIFFSETDPLPDVAEKKLWQAYIEEGLGNYKKADGLYDESDRLIAGYPAPLRSLFFLSRLKAAIENNSLSKVNDWIKNVPASQLTSKEKNAYNYYLGKIMEMKNDKDEAAYRYYIKLYKNISVQKDPYNYYRVLKEIVLLGEKLGRVSSNDAIKILRNISMNWRGDNMEFDCLHTMRDIYLKHGQYIEAFDVMLDIVQNYPDRDVAEKTRKSMITKFVKYFTNDKVLNKDLLYSLEFYNKYRFLLKNNENAHFVLRSLSDSLLKNGLLKQAWTLLSYEAKHYLSGNEKSQVGVKLAYIDLLRNNPKQALKDLKMTESFGNNLTISRKRGQLQAQALVMLNKDDDALQVLAGDVSPTADHIRIKIYWSREDWISSIQVLQRLAGNPPSDPTKSLSDQSAHYVLDWAVALRLSHDTRGRELLDQQYGSFMRKTPLANLYNYVISPDVGEGDNLDDTLSKLVDTKQFDTFMSDFKKRMSFSDNSKKNSGVSSKGK